MLKIWHTMYKAILPVLVQEGHLGTASEFEFGTGES